MDFVKMHGLGNNFILINALKDNESVNFLAWLLNCVITTLE